jgi:hypothetical protein
MESTYTLQWTKWTRFGRETRESVLTKEFTTKAEAMKYFNVLDVSYNAFMSITENKA